MSEHGIDSVVETYNQTLHGFVNGDAGPMVELFSRGGDVTLANPLGPPRVGWTEVEAAIDQAGSNFAAGSIRIEEVSRCATADMAYVVQIERIEARLVGDDDPVRISLRATVVFRREADGWKVVHRHADPITTARPMATVVED